MNMIQSIIFLIASMVAISGFYIQGIEFIIANIRGQSIQSILIASLSFIMGFLERSLDLIILGIMVVILRVILINYFLERTIPKKRKFSVEKYLSVPYLLIVDLIFIVLSVILIYEFVFSSMILHENIAPSNILVFPLITFFQGMFLIASRKSTHTQIIGYVEEENAMILFGIFLLPIPLIIEASIFLDVLALVVISSIIVLEKNEHNPVEDLIG